MSHPRKGWKGILPVQISRTYPPAGVCIYCGSNAGLEDEHIFPYGLGGNLILPKSSCRNCSRRSSAYEGTCQRSMFGPFRMLYEMPTRRKKDRPETLPLKVKHTADQADWSTIDVPREEVPFLILLPEFPMPELLTARREPNAARGAASKKFWIRGASASHGIYEHMDALIARLGVHSVMPVGEGNVPAFCLMLAKIAHSFATAELGVGSFEPLLVPALRDGDLSERAAYMGSSAVATPAAPILHEIAVGYSPRRALVLVRMRLLACLGTPTYHIVVGRADRFDPVTKGRRFRDPDM